MKQNFEEYCVVYIYICVWLTKYEKAHVQSEKPTLTSHTRSHSLWDMRRFMPDIIRPTQICSNPSPPPRVQHSNSVRTAVQNYESENHFRCSRFGLSSRRNNVRVFPFFFSFFVFFARKNFLVVHIHTENLEKKTNFTLWKFYEYAKSFFKKLLYFLRGLINSASGVENRKWREKCNLFYFSTSLYENTTENTFSMKWYQNYCSKNLASILVTKFTI